MPFRRARGHCLLALVAVACTEPRNTPAPVVDAAPDARPLPDAPPPVDTAGPPDRPAESAAPVDTAPNPPDTGPPVETAAPVDLRPEAAPCMPGTCPPFTATAVSGGRWHSCALVTPGRARCWGWGSSGQLGDGNRYESLTGVGVALADVNAISASDTHSCALSRGIVNCWGSSSNGQLGLGPGIVAPQPLPQPVPGLYGVTAIAATQARAHTCALARGSVHCWGWNMFGQVGNGTKTDVGSPTEVGGIAGATAIAVGAHHSCAVIAGGAVRCWGLNETGQLGHPTPGEYTRPVAASNVSDAVELAAGWSFTCALLRDQDVQCWGLNMYGTSGIVPGVRGVTVLAAGNTHACAVVGGGTVKCWGNSVNGQLGTGQPTGAYHDPATVPGLSDVRALGAGEEHTCAVTAAGKVFCWGHNHHGQVGDGTTNDAYTPVEVKL